MKRFIPAGAGNTCRVLAVSCAVSVHPRRCGEHAGKERCRNRPNGSSPQVRGTPEEAKEVLLRTAVHPRRCGEHSPTNPGGTLYTGSSPQVRGTLPNGDQFRTNTRFIPAGAGNTMPYILAVERPTVHPRRCGEHCMRETMDEMNAGSSPQVRGTPATPFATSRWRRFIPAGAGNTYPSTAHRCESPVHPRRCGEHSSAESLPPSAAGSSPQVRGTLLAATTGARVVAVHPRRCGEHLIVEGPDVLDHGSSPQVRGTRSRAGNGHSCGTVHPRRCGEHRGGL